MNLVRWVLSGSQRYFVDTFALRTNKVGVSFGSLHPGISITRKEEFPAGVKTIKVVRAIV